MKRERILITVKTYPVLSSKHIELVCTAGVREDGTWVRIYPSPFRFLENDKQYGKYHWVDIDLEKNPKDSRPESYRPVNLEQMVVGDKIGTENAWEARKKIIIAQNVVHTNLNTIIDGAKNNQFSLVVFKPAEVLDFIVRESERDWELSRKEAAKAALTQGQLFDDEDRSGFKLMPKLPYKFSYRFRDDEGTESTLMIEDWEIGQLYWNCLEGINEKEAIRKVKEKYLDDFVKTKDLHLFLGTTHEHHMRKARNPYVIVGTFYPPFVHQESLF